ncbi:MAG: hypothetical protein ABSD42_06850 [Candidatus Bathyarchaeia archaeon]|jgi:hypothetical protein
MRLIFETKEHVLQPYLNQATEEEKTVGAPAKKTLLTIARVMVLCAPNLYSTSYSSRYSVEEKTVALQLLKKYGYAKLCNLSPRYKKATVQLIEQELAREA